jgi:hypothetical protein
LHILKVFKAFHVCWLNATQLDATAQNRKIGQELAKHFPAWATACASRVADTPARSDFLMVSAHERRKHR